VSHPIFLTLEEVVERYRGQISEGTLRNWRSMRIGPSFIKIGKAILYPLEELDRWDRRNLVISTFAIAPFRRSGRLTCAGFTGRAELRSSIRAKCSVYDIDTDSASVLQRDRRVSQKHLRSSAGLSRSITSAGLTRPPSSEVPSPGR
jgi:hypothetical protein